MANSAFDKGDIAKFEDELCQSGEDSEIASFMLQVFERGKAHITKHLHKLKVGIIQGIWSQLPIKSTPIQYLM